MTKFGTIDALSFAELRAVVAVARHLNFRLAAVELGVSRSSLSRSVAILETRLGTRLFHRTTRSVALTHTGREFADAIAPVLRALDDAVVSVGAAREKPTGSLRINTTASGARQVMPLLLAFVARYPDIHLDLVTEGRLIDIVRAGFDAGIRIAEIVPQDMTRIPFGDVVEPAVLASPDYLERHPAPHRPEDLAAHRCIRARMPSGTIWKWEFERAGATFGVEVDGPLTLDDTSLMLAAAASGAGLAYATLGEAREHLASGRLVRVLAEWTPAYPGLCLYYPPGRTLPSGLRALVDFIAERRSRGIAPSHP